MSEIILTIKNQHIAESGTPPKIDTIGKRVSYFQNQFGEQWFFVSCDSSQTGVLTGGEVEWTEHSISWDKLLPEFSLDAAETFWLYGCIYALFRKEQPEIQARIDEAEKQRAKAVDQRGRKDIGGKA